MPLRFGSFILLLSLTLVAARGDSWILGNGTLVSRDPSSDPTDFSWIKKWAAVGDSFTAGIGSGGVYSKQSEDISCSRYDYSYPVIMNHFFGPSVKTFKYDACSGATSMDIASQISGLPNDLDLAVLTAGGNDLCLSTIISKCILQSVTTEAACSGAVSKAQKAIDNILHDNIVSLLTSLDAKVNDDGMIVLASYAQYFNAETTDCTHNQDWVFPGQAGSTSLLLTKDRRATFNSLVRNTNSVLKSAVKDASKKAKSKIIFADWDEWGAVTNGRFCEPGADPHPIDESNEDVLFFKLPTYKILNPGTIFRREDEWDLVGGPNNYANISAAEEEEALGIQLSDVSVSVTDLDKRGSISPPACKKSALSGLLPDGIGRIFHPNEVGHETIASFVTWAIANARAKKLDVPSPACIMETEFTCYQGQGSKQYASAYSLYLHTADFCKSATERAKDESSGWSFSKTYNKKTLDEATFSVSLDAESSDLDEKSCNAAVNRILDGCDGNDPENPMNWKFGGKYDTGGYTYSIAPQRKNRPFPVLKKPIGKCQGWYRFLYTRYNIRGAGWATWDSGQKTLRPNSTDCFGLGLTGWYFEYFDEPDENGFMWLAKFNSPIWTEARCYANNKVQSGAGGPSDAGCI